MKRLAMLFSCFLIALGVVNSAHANWQDAGGCEPRGGFFQENGRWYMYDYNCVKYGPF